MKKATRADTSRQGDVPFVYRVTEFLYYYKNSNTYRQKERPLVCVFLI